MGERNFGQRVIEDHFAAVERAFNSLKAEIGNGTHRRAAAAATLATLSGLLAEMTLERPRRQKEIRNHPEVPRYRSPSKRAPLPPSPAPRVYPGCSEGRMHRFTPDLDADPTGATRSCELCGEIEMLKPPPDPVVPPADPHMG